MEEPGLLSELETFVRELEDYGPVYYDLRDQVRNTELYFSNWFYYLSSYK